MSGAPELAAEIQPWLAVWLWLPSASNSTTGESGAGSAGFQVSAEAEREVVETSPVSSNMARRTPHLPALQTWSCEELSGSGGRVLAEDKCEADHEEEDAL